MKRNILFTLALVATLSCENDITPALIGDFNIQQIVSNSNTDHSQTDDFSYNVDNKLISVKRNLAYDGDFAASAELIEFQYEGETLVSRTHQYLPSDTIHQKISYTYLPNGSLHKELYAYTYTGELQVEWINEYEYSPNGDLFKKSSYNPDSPDTRNWAQYYWKNGNVNKIENYYGGSLRYESFFTYDNATNYKLGNPFFNDYEASLVNKNNLTQVKYVDYSGVLDLACNPCNYAYQYNNQSLPVKVTGPSSFASELTISYEMIERDIN